MGWNGAEWSPVSGVIGSIGVGFKNGKSLVLRFPEGTDRKLIKGALESKGLEIVCILHCSHEGEGDLTIWPQEEWKS